MGNKERGSPIKSLWINELSCSKCCWIWKPRDSKVVPKVCPRCKSYKWQGSK